MDAFEGEVAVVTGSASGLGRAMAERFAQEGMTSVIADRRLRDAEAVADSILRTGGRAAAIEVDVAKRDSMLALADRVDAELGGASVLVNNAGVIPNTPILEPEDLAWRWVIDVNLLGVIHGLQVFDSAHPSTEDRPNPNRSASYLKTLALWRRRLGDRGEMSATRESAPTVCFGRSASSISMCSPIPRIGR
jgi:NAD(P)-dependent dehydrogenase (short-subunit alcohol dehydrogenase family)